MFLQHFIICPYICFIVFQLGTPVFYSIILSYVLFWGSCLLITTTEYILLLPFFPLQHICSLLRVFYCKKLHKMRKKASIIMYKLKIHSNLNFPRHSLISHMVAPFHLVVKQVKARGPQLPFMQTRVHL